MIHESMMIKSNVQKEPKAVRFVTDAALCKAYQAGDRNAGDRVLRRHMPFCHTVTNHFARVPIPREDLFQVACWGMLHAASKYEASKGVLFTSFAIWWMKAFISRHIDENCHTIRLPANKQQALSRAFVAMGCGKKMGEEESEALQHYLETSCVSLDAKPGSGNVTYAEMIAGDDGRDGKEQKDMGLLRRYVADLPHKEAKVIRLLYGLDSGEKMTLREVGEMMGVTHERVRQIKDEALKRLRKGLAEADWV